MKPTILVIGAFDTKGEEYAFLREQILLQGCDTLMLNFGVLGSTEMFPVDIETEQVAHAVQEDLISLRSKQDRGNAMSVMAAGVQKVVSQLNTQQKFDAIIGMGGSGGSSVITSAMRALPLGLPKVCISTVAGGDTSPYVGTKDITLIPSVTDVAGLNRISRILLTRAAGAICGMASASPQASTEDLPVVAASMFGNTTQCVDSCRELLSKQGFEVLVFHATGTGGRTMESLIDEGLVDFCLDITTTELADTICGGVFDAGEDRLSAAGRRAIPQLIAPGCVDMANFGPPGTVPKKYRETNRNLYEWNPSVTLMRTNVEENRRMGEIIAQKANEAKGPAAILLPTRGFSILGGENQPFFDPVADQALCDAIKKNIAANIKLVELDANINEPKFAEKAVAMLLELKKQQPDVANT